MYNRIGVYKTKGEASRKVKAIKKRYRDYGKRGKPGIVNMEQRKDGKWEVWEKQ